jgi:predicted metalloendopeptidase
MKNRLALLLAPVLLAGPALAGPKVPADAPAGTDLTVEQIAASVAAALDPKTDPCVDFYRYACGGWLDQVELPADESEWVRSFSVIHERNRELLRELIESAARDAGADADRRRIGAYYGACMDEAAIEKAGLEPVAPWLAKIDAAADRDALFALAGELQTIQAAPFFDVQVFADLRDPDTVVAHLSQGGLGLPERDYYLSEAEDQRQLRTAYQKHVARMLVFAGLGEEAAAKRAGEVLAFETALATASRPVERMRIVEELHHRLDAPGLAQLTPTLAWPRFFAAAGRPELAEINVMTPEFFEALARELAAADLGVLRDYVRYHLVTAVAGLLPDHVYQAHFDFYGRTLGGQAEPQPRWKRCIQATEQAMGEPIGRLYVAERFPGRSKQIAEAMIGDITAAFEASLPRLAWMDEATRRAARVKKGTLEMKIGYPEKWRDYSALEVAAGAHFANALAARRFESAWQIAKVGRPVDRAEFPMDPQVVNASYNPLQNAFTYPAGILQPPFFHKDFPEAMNLGAIGLVIGHELTHGFDDQGRKFNEKGELTDWWTPESVAGFEQRAACIERQYSGYEVEPGVAVNGKLTLGENIGDNGGLRQAWDALQKKQRERGEAPKLAGLTEDQLFFVAAAQIWCTEATPEALRLLVQTDPHSPPKFRVIGPVVNHPGFGEAFSCRPGAPMNPVEKCEVW